MIDKFQAALLGFAIGDALAAPIEDVVFQDPGDAVRVREYVKAFPSHPVSHLEPGQYSDETQLMLLVGRSVVASRGFSLDDLVKRFIDWFQSQRLREMWRFPSNTVMKACRKLAAGVPPSMSGGMSAGVAATVRTVPLALAFWRQPALLKNAIEKSCRITHADARVVGAALVLATAIKMGLEGNEPAVDVLVNQAIERAQVFAPDIGKRLNQMRMCLRLDPGPAMEQIGHGGYCLETVPAALYWFFRHPRRFDDMIIGAANVGGDSDAVAAMAGAVFGAFNGLGGISDRWLRHLEDVADIKQMGCDLYRLAVPQN